MSRPSALDTRPSTHRAHDFAQAQKLTAGLSPAYLAYAVAKQEGWRQLAHEVACDQLPAATPPRLRTFQLARLGLPRWVRSIARTARPSHRRVSSPAGSPS